MLTGWEYGDFSETRPKKSPISPSFGELGNVAVWILGKNNNIAEILKMK